MLHNDVEYLMDDVIKEFIDECFMKDVIFVKILYTAIFMMKSGQITTTPSPIITSTMHA